LNEDSRNNCRVTYWNTVTGEVFDEDFYDPYIYISPSGQVIRWDGDNWYVGVSYAGVGIKNKLKVADPRFPLPKH
jgi:hypothetical protein